MLELAVGEQRARTWRAVGRNVKEVGARTGQSLGLEDTTKAQSPGIGPKKQ